MKKHLAMRLCTAILASGVIAGAAKDGDEWEVYVLRGDDVYRVTLGLVGPASEFKDRDIFKALFKPLWE